MKIGFLYPGQGSQSIGMGSDLYENYSEIREMYDKVKEITKIDIAKISFEGPEEILNQTKYTQLAILTMSLAITEVLKKHNINADISAGLSLGEYSALIYSGAIDLEDGIRVVQKRGEYMQNLAPEGDWLMAAILGMEDIQVENVCEKVKSGFVVAANYNCPGQVVISGEKKAVEEAADIAKQNGAKRVQILKTAGPFHTKKLEKASLALKKELNNVKIYPFRTEVVKNIDGKIYTNADDIRDILAKHIINPVKFSKTIETMLGDGVDTFIEIGPGRTLSSFTKKTSKDMNINIFNINNAQTLKELIDKGGKK